MLTRICNRRSMTALTPAASRSRLAARGDHLVFVEADVDIPFRVAGAHVSSLGRLGTWNYLTSDREHPRRSLPDGVLGMVPGPNTTTLRGRISTSASTS